MTICTVEREDYFLRRIRGEEEPLLIEMRDLRSNLETVAARMIAWIFLVSVLTQSATE